jgi:nucleoside-diphosphate-sugar epimerase
VFLTGATGYIGTAVAERLRAAGHQLSGLARSDQAAAKLVAAGITPVRGDFTNPAAVASGARSANAVISMATTYDSKVDAPAVDAILDALAGSNKPFIYTSGIWVNGDTGGIVADETTPAEPVELVAWRKGVEDRVLEAAGRGVRSVVIRPAIVYGRGGGIPAGFRDSAKREGAARFVGTGENRWPLCAGPRAGAGRHAAVGRLRAGASGEGTGRGRESRRGRAREHGRVADRAGPRGIGERLRRCPHARPAGLQPAGRGAARLAAASTRADRGPGKRVVCGKR